MFTGLNANYAYDVLIGKSIARTTGVQITDPTAVSTYIADGEVVVLNHNDQPLTPGATIADSPFIRIVQRSGNNLRYSMKIDGLNVFEYVGKSGANGQEQIYVLGFNGTNGSIDTTATSRILRITYKFDDKWEYQPYRRSYFTDSSTQESIANSIMVDMNADSHPALIGNQASAGFISVVALCSATGSNSSVLGGSSTLTVSKGSNVATASSGSHGLVAGDWVRIGSEDGVTFPVYKVKEVSGTTITFTTPYQGSSGTITNANTGRITAAVAATSDFGLRMTGLPLSFGVYPSKHIPYNKVAFDLHVSSDWGSTPLTKTQERSFGTGLYEQVVFMEQMGKVFKGVDNLLTTPIPSAMTSVDAIPGTLYDCIYISFAEVSHSLIAPTTVNKHETYVFLADGASQTTNILAQLNPWMASLPKSFAAISSL